MIRRIIFTLILITASILSYAQYSYAVKGGLNVTNLYSNRFGLYDWRPSYHLGVSVDHSITKHLYATSDLLYSGKGFSSNGNNIHFTYISLPFMIGYSLTGKLSVEVGGGLNYLVSSFSKIKGERNNTIDIWGNRLDFELCAGFRYSLSSRINLTLRYEHGLSNIINKNSTFDLYGSNDPNIQGSVKLRDTGWKEYNRNFQVSVSYIFYTKKKKQ